MTRRFHSSHQPAIPSSVRIVDRAAAGASPPAPPGTQSTPCCLRIIPAPGSNHDRTRNRACRLPVGIYSRRRLREGRGPGGAHDRSADQRSRNHQLDHGEGGGVRMENESPVFEIFVHECPHPIHLNHIH